MKKNLFVIMVLISAGILLTACKNNAGENNAGENKTVENNIPTSSPTYKRQSNVIVYPTDYPASQSVTWVMQYFDQISEQNQKEINRILYEKGTDCQIRFVRTDAGTGAEYSEFLKQNADSISFDIITSGGWSSGDPEMISFVERSLFPLNDYLDKEEARALRETYAEDEWKQVTLNGKVYVIPRGPGGADKGVSVYVNDEYAEYFREFDGSYASLKEIYETIGDDSLHIENYRISNTRALYALVGYSGLYYGYLPYSPEKEATEDITLTEKLPNLLKEIYDDLKSGVMVNSARTNDSSGKALAVIHDAGSFQREGFSEHAISCDLREFNCAMRCGIYADSLQKDLAFRVLSICFSDSEILHLLTPEYFSITKQTVGNEQEESKIDTSAVKYRGELAGIRFSFSEDQVENIHNYSNSFLRLFAEMYICPDPDKDPNYFILNPAWDIDASWNAFKNETGYFSDLCNTANDEIASWLNETKE